MDENFEKIKRRADSYGYNINYGRVKDTESNHDLVKIIVAGTIVIGGFLYLKKKLKNLISDIFNDEKEPELKPCNVEEFHETSTEDLYKRKDKVLVNDFDKSDAIDVDYTVHLYDKSHPDNLNERSYKCQF